LGGLFPAPGEKAQTVHGGEAHITVTELESTIAAIGRSLGL
jgi:hypothetical protein